MDGWRSLLSKEWADYVILHNLPIGISTIPDLILDKQFSFSVRKVPKFNRTVSSIYELSKSAANWDYSDF